MKCLICDNDLMFIAKRKDKYSYYRCKKCGLITCFPKPTDREIQNYYTGFFSNKKPFEGKKFNLISDSVFDDVKKISSDIKKIKDFNKKNISLLDFGGGRGFYSNAFQKSGFNVTLFEIDEESIEYVRKHFNNFKVVNKLSSKNKFDIIYCNHVIEHCKEPDLFLRDLKKYLKKNSLLIITTPNQECREFYFRPPWLMHYLSGITGKKFYKLPYAASRFLKYPWICCDPPRHLYSFNKNNFARLLKKEKFTPLKIFTEYSTMQYYTMKFNCNLKIDSVKSIFRFFHNLYALAGIRFLKFIDKNNDFGSGLVAYAENKSA